MSPHGDVVEKEFRIPPHHDVVTVSSYLGCEQEDSFLVLQDTSDETTVATLDKESALLSGDRRILDSVPLNWLARSSFVRDEELFQFTDKAQLATIDFKNSSVTYSDALLPPHQRTVNLTFDNDEFYVVSQSQDGGPELEVRAYSLESPTLKEKGERLGSMSSLLGNSASSAHPYVIPLAIYPRDPR
ncbi:hypothetical protein [Corynebacterium sp.]|uniref:hypothetical protein n=1 Tax=Corynebacterium sp. TaxID=1720 RepID=UPI0026DCCCEF|nr:hypothetical protein [Corynebacterium sp.]MDO5032256.1 hypothetical protein [Corynebacterium sp.]